MLKVFIFALILIGITVFIFIPKGYVTNQTYSLPSDSAPPTQPIYVYDGPILKTVPFLTETLVKRQFDPASKFVIGGGKDSTPSAAYPKAVTNIPEEKLQSLKCTVDINARGTGFTVYKDKQNFLLQIEDKTYQKVLSKINAESGDYGIQRFDYCLDEKGIRLIHFYQAVIGANNQPPQPDNFLLIDPSGAIKKVSINIGPYNYMSCNKPLQLTTDNILYYSCGGGDITSYYEIHKIDFNKLNSTMIISCSQSEGDAIAEPNPPLICK